MVGKGYWEDRGGGRSRDEVPKGLIAATRRSNAGASCPVFQQPSRSWWAAAGGGGSTSPTVAARWQPSGSSDPLSAGQ